MAGSLNHIVKPDGTFTIRNLDGRRDDVEALHECFNIIAELVGGDMIKLRRVCQKLNFPEPKACPVVTPVPRGEPWP